MRTTEEMKMWLFNLAHGNLTENEEIVKGFIKHYVLHGCVIGDVQDDITFHTLYGENGVKIAMESLRKALEEFSE